MLRSLPPYYLVRNPLRFIYEYIVYVSAQQITIITMERNSCLIHFQILPNFLGLPKHISKQLFKNNGDTTSHVELHSNTLKQTFLYKEKFHFSIFKLP